MGKLVKQLRLSMMATGLTLFFCFASIESHAEVLGQYINDYGGGIIEVMTISMENGRYYIQVAYKDGSKGKKKYRATKTKIGIKLQEFTPNRYGDYYILNKNGNLETWDSQGKIGTVVNVK